MKPELGHARDVYSFAVLAEELLEKLTDLGNFKCHFCYPKTEKQHPNQGKNILAVNMSLTVCNAIKIWFCGGNENAYAKLH